MHYLLFCYPGKLLGSSLLHNGPLKTGKDSRTIDISERQGPPLYDPQLDIDLFLTVNPMQFSKLERHLRVSRF
jgi:hypothetical protein